MVTVRTGTPERFDPVDEFHLNASGSFARIPLKMQGRFQTREKFHKLFLRSGRAVVKTRPLFCCEARMALPVSVLIIRKQ
jgi:hypothetical protein